MTVNDGSWASRTKQEAAGLLARPDREGQGKEDLKMCTGLSPLTLDAEVARRVEVRVILTFSNQPRTVVQA